MAVASGPRLAVAATMLCHNVDATVVFICDVPVIRYAALNRFSVSTANSSLFFCDYLPTAV